MFGKPQAAPAAAAPAATVVPDPVRIPTPNDPDIVMARRQRISAEFRSRQGRDSTMLETGGGNNNPTYSRTTLG